MDLDCNFTALTQVLEALSPSSVINSPALLSRFHDFITRCTASERQLLFLPMNRQPRTVSTKRERPDDDHESPVYKSQRVSGAERSRSRSFPQQSYSSLRSRPSTGSLNHDEMIDLQISRHSSWTIATSSTPPLAGRSTCPPWPSSMSSTASTNIVNSLPSITSNSALNQQLYDGLGAPFTTSGISSYLASTVPFEVLSEARTFFERRLGSRANHAKYLVRAVRGFMEAMHLDPESYRNFWSSRSKIFIGTETGPLTRFRRLYNGLIQIKRRREDNDCASRLCHIFLEHDLEQLLESGYLQASRGRNKKNSTISAEATSISETVASIKADRKAGRGYLQLLMEAGPGLLLIVGSQVNTVWERKLSREDITLLLQYLRQTQPDILEKGRSLDEIASSLIIDGLIAYGWTHSGLVDLRSKLLEQLRLYVDFSQLARQRMKEETPASCEFRAATPPSPADSLIHEANPKSEQLVYPFAEISDFDRTRHTSQNAHMLMQNDVPATEILINASASPHTEIDSSHQRCVESTRGDCMLGNYQHTYGTNHDNIFSSPRPHPPQTFEAAIFYSMAELSDITPDGPGGCQEYYDSELSSKERAEIFFRSLSAEDGPTQAHLGNSFAGSVSPMYVSMLC